ncbi:MAG: Crp/Fnr family transcriptional regulator, partial [Nitrospiraceae bacterium]
FQDMKRSLLFEPNQVVFYEGHVCLGLYLLCAGRVKLTRTSARGHRVIVGILDAGGLIEQHAWRDGALHEVTCEAMEPSQICVIDKERYLALLKRNPGLAVKLLQSVSQELGAQTDRLEAFAFKTARERVAGLLLELAERFGRNTGDGLQVGIPLKREELAEMAGVAVETVIRLLGAFRDQGLVSLGEKTITLMNRDRLVRIAGR